MVIISNRVPWGEGGHVIQSTNMFLMHSFLNYVNSTFKSNEVSLMNNILVVATMLIAKYWITYSSNKRRIATKYP